MHQIRDDRVLQHGDDSFEAVPALVHGGRRYGPPNA
jgi:hypothetical protein